MKKFKIFNDRYQQHVSGPYYKRVLDGMRSEGVRAGTNESQSHETVKKPKAASLEGLGDYYEYNGGEYVTDRDEVSITITIEHKNIASKFTNEFDSDMTSLSYY